MSFVPVSFSFFHSRMFLGKEKHSYITFRTCLYTIHTTLKKSNGIGTTVCQSISRYGTAQAGKRDTALTHSCYTVPLSSLRVFLRPSPAPSNGAEPTLEGSRAVSDIRSSGHLTRQTKRRAVTLLLQSCSAPAAPQEADEPLPLPAPHTEMVLAYGS